MRSETLPGDHDARAHVESAGHAVGLGDHHAGDAEILAADAQHVAGAHLRPQQQIVGDGYGVRLSARAPAAAAD